MSWEKVKIGDVYEGLYDGPHATPPTSDDGAIFLGISNITKDGHIDLSDIKHINENDLPNGTKRVTPKCGDIVFSYEATLNLYAIIPDDFWGCLGRRMALIRPDETKAHGKYLYYYFFSEEWRSTVSSHIITGATVDRIPISKFPEFIISLPPMEKQHKIANILSNYDDLIVNNKKQIKLLEEAAQRLYKEWFVDLRFPGYEDVKIVDGVPEGWTDGTLGDVATFKRGKTITKAQIHDGDVPVVAGGLEPAYYHNVSNTVAPVITVSGSGANAGFARLYNVNVFASDCSFADSDTTPYLFFVYCFIKSNKDSFNALQKGSAQPHVYAKDINALKILIPKNKIIEEFCGIVSPHFEKIKILQMQIQLSTQARDRLLPKLMSGEIEV